MEPSTWCSIHLNLSCKFNSLKTEQNGQPFVEKKNNLFSQWNISRVIPISLKFVPWDLFGGNLALVRAMARYQIHNCHLQCCNNSVSVSISDVQVSDCNNLVYAILPAFMDKRYLYCNFQAIHLTLIGSCNRNQCLLIIHRFDELHQHTDRCHAIHHLTCPHGFPYFQLTAKLPQNLET